MQARRLRAQLTRYYREEAPDSELLIELPKGGYAPIFKQVKSAPARRSTGPALVGRNTVAVLPFSDHSAAGDQKYFCDGIAQEIIHTLACAEEIRVVAWNGGGAASGEAAMQPAARSNAAVMVTR